VTIISLIQFAGKNVTSETIRGKSCVLQQHLSPAQKKILDGG